ncbi:hypothetical protein BA190_10255 [Labrys sp. WJW]|uniref:phage tail protein n=1 Tax=Labrys sp. WJW TaxID=1737983 RepID=UPI00082E09CE|nr:phage tail protein [Labrys sp. WJW]OCC05276.1 hypothetical protein BA190_10255 [Labrys sp. WJW]
MLYQLGGTQFDVVPFNTHETDHEMGGDFAAKDLIGTMRDREFVGPSDEKLTFSCRIFPAKFGGLEELEGLQVAAVSGEPQILVRGDGTNLGWWVIDKVGDKATFLDIKGVGRVIEVQIAITRVPVPGKTTILGALLRLFG